MMRKSFAKFSTLFGITLLTLFCVSATAQTPEEFKQRYGNPQSGVYRVRDAITAKATFDNNNQAVEIDVAPLRSGAPRAAMSAAEAAEILDELVPPVRRGKLVNRGKFSASCAMGHFEEYEYISIMWSDRCESQGGGVFGLTIRRTDGDSHPVPASRQKSFSTSAQRTEWK